MKIQLFGNDVIFSSSRVSVSDNCKQSILSDFYCKRFTDIVLKLGIVPTNGKIALQRQTAHADAVSGLPLPGLRRTTEPVQSARPQTFLTVLNFHPLSG